MDSSFYLSQPEFREALQRENEDLRTATSQNQNVVLELTLDAEVQYLSDYWEDIVGTSIRKILCKPISRIIVGDDADRDVFARATKVMIEEDTSYRVRFVVRMGNNMHRLDLAPTSASSPLLKSPTPHHPAVEIDDSFITAEPIDNSDDAGNDDKNSDLASITSSISLGSLDSELLLEMVGQGILIRDSSGHPSHTMWTLKPHREPKPLKIDLPAGLAETLGFGVNMLVDYLEELSDSVVNEQDSVPAPSFELCRVCERNQPTWWFERHSNLCTLEHLAESDLQVAHEALLEHRTTLAALLASVDTRTSVSCVSHHFADPPISSPGSFSSAGSSVLSGSPSSASSSPTSYASNSPVEYKGLALPLPINSPDPPPPPVSLTVMPTGSPPRSPRLPTSPLVPSSARRLMNKPPPPFAGGSSSKRSPVRFMELLLELCDMAIQINVPEINKKPVSDEDDEDGEDHIRIHSPHSETKIHQVLDWSSPSSMDDPALALLCSDTETFCRAKVSCALRMGNILLFSEKIRTEVEEDVQALIERTIERASKRRDSNEDSAEDDADYPEDSVIKHSESDVFQDDGDNDDIDHSKHSLFSDAYLQADILPVPGNKSQRAFSNSNVSPCQMPLQPPVTAMQKLMLDTSNDDEDNHRDHPVAAGTPRSSLIAEPRTEEIPLPIFGDMQPLPLITNLDSYKMKEQPESVADSDTSHDDLQIGELDLNNVTRLRPRKSLSSVNMSVPRMHGSPLSSLKRNRIHCSSTTESNSPSTPVSSPLFFPYDVERHHRRQSSAASDFVRYPVSPLLTSTVPSLKPPQPSIRDYEIICPISKGAFGSVYLSRKKLTGELFAIKVLKKADMIAKNQVMNVKSERAIMMSQADSPFVAKLFYTFQSRDYLFLVMEYLNGGDCASLLKALGGLPEVWTRKYIAEVIVGVENLHKKNIVHRDLKPDNLLIDHRGHLKLTDFGLSRMGAAGRHTRGVRGSTRSGVSSILESPTESAGNIVLRSDLSRGSSISGGLLHDPSISLVPGYFNYAGSSSSSLSALFERRAASAGRHDSEAAAGETGAPATEGDKASSASSDHAFPLGTTQLPHRNSSSTSTGTSRVALFDPEDKEAKRFAGTPDYLAPETIRGLEQDEMSDWWSLGCILFEFLYGYPPFHASTPELVFQNILDGTIQWPGQLGIIEKEVSPEAKDLVVRLLCDDRERRLGAKGTAEIKSHPFFKGIDNWGNLWDEEASFIPAVENPESTDYFDLRGAVMEEFPDDMAVEESEGVTSGSNDEQSDTNDQVSRATTGSPLRLDRKPKFLPLHIPPHVREGRVRRLSEPSFGDDFGSFAFKNIPVLEKANQELISKLRIESKEREARSRRFSVSLASVVRSNTTSTNSSGSSRQSSPVRQSSSGSGSIIPSHQGSFQTPQKKSGPVGPAVYEGNNGAGTSKTAEIPIPRRGGFSFRRLSNMESSPELRDQFRKQSLARGKAIELSPCSSDTEESRGAALLRVQKRRQLSRKLSTSQQLKSFRVLDVLVCDSNPVWRYSAEKMLVEIGNRVVSVGSGQEAIRRATGHVKFDLILIEYKLPRSTGADVARLIHNTVNPNTDTPVVAMAMSWLVREGTENGRNAFADVVEKPLTEEKIVALLEQQCSWVRPSLSLS